MKLGDMFQAPKPRTLAQAPKPAATPAAQKPQAGALETVISAKRKPGDLGIPWPIAKAQKVKDYKPILSLNDLNLYLDRCIELKTFSFDWETAANEATRAKWQLYKNEYFQRRGFLESQEFLADNQPLEVEPTKTEKQREAATKRAKKLHAAAVQVWTDKIKDLDSEFQKARDEYLKTPLDPWKAEICTLSIAAAEHEARVLPISHKAGRIFEPELTRDAARKLVMDTLDRRIFRAVDVTKIAVNLAFETKFAAKYGKYILGAVADPFLMWVRCLQVAFPHKINDPKEPATGWGLKPATIAVFGVIMGEFMALLNKYGVDFFDEIPADHGDGLNYSAEDSDYSLQHYNLWRPVAQQIPMYDDWLHRIEMPFARVVGLMEFKGMGWDTHTAEMKRQEAAAAFQHETAELKRIVKEATGLDIDTGKTGKTGGVKSVLFDVMRLPLGKPTDKGGISLDEEALLDIQFMLENKLLNLDEEKLLETPLPEGWESIDIPPALKEGERQPQGYFTQYQDWNRLTKEEQKRVELERREPNPYLEPALKMLGHMRTIQKYTTLLSSHVDGREKYLNIESGGRIHAGYNPFTETARLKSMRPNGQNVPRVDTDRMKVRTMYRAPMGRIMFFIDFAGFELRILAYKSGDEVMIEIFRTGGDMHAKTASELVERPQETVTKQERIDAKPANFGIAYGGTEFSLQKTLKTDYGQRKSLPACRKMVEAVHRAYKRIKEYQRKATLDARELGYTQTEYGYIRMLPNINSSNSYLKGSEERRAGNTPIQGTAADFMKRAQNDVYEEIGRGTILAFESLEAAERGAMTGVNLLEHSPLADGKTDMIAQIHDEIIFEMDDDPDTVEAAWHWVQAAMEKEPLPGFPIPILAEASVGYNWGEKVDVQKWLDEKRAQAKGA